MGYYLEALIGQYAVLVPHREDYAQAQLVRLEQGLALFPLTNRLYDEIQTRSGKLVPDHFPGFARLSVAVAEWVRQISRQGAIGYIEANFFDGVGTQSAIIWEAGQVLFGPVRTEVKWEKDNFIAPSLQDWAINQTLRRLGADASAGQDEFDAVGLSRYRYTADWLDEEDE